MRRNNYLPLNTGELVFFSSIATMIRREIGCWTIPLVWNLLMNERSKTIMSLSCLGCATLRTQQASSEPFWISLKVGT
jgi:hypothetical protein